MEARQGRKDSRRSRGVVGGEKGREKGVGQLCRRLERKDYELD